MRIQGFNLAISACATLLFVAGCASAPPSPKHVPIKAKVQIPDAPPVPAHSETVLNNGMVVTASTPAGKITVSAGPGLLRTLSWDGQTRYVVTQARSKPHFGSQGIYFDGRPGNWKTYNGLSGVHYEEGARHFDNADDASIWMQIRRLRYVYTNNGLVIGWKRNTSENELQVEVWQFNIGGNKPSIMQGAKDYLIQTRQAPLRADNS